VRNIDPRLSIQVAYLKNTVATIQPALTLTAPAALDKAQVILLPIIDGEDAPYCKAYMVQLGRPTLGPAKLIFWTPGPGRYLLSVPAFDVAVELDILAGYRCQVVLKPQR